MVGPFAEVIGDPIAQSKSPIIHKHWLKELGIAGDYVRTRVAAHELGAFLDRRRADPDWRGCNVTIPHKERVIPLLDRIDAGAVAIGAVNCVVPQLAKLAGYNTDVGGVAATLDSVELEGAKAAVIGGGGAARAVITYLARRKAGRIAVLVRNPARAEPLRALAPDADVAILPLESAGKAFEDAAAIVNASPLGMAGAAEMPPAIIDAIIGHANGIIAFDLVTTPAETAFLAAARTGGAKSTVDGLTMLVGQARRAFELFFGCLAPADDAELRRFLASQSLEGQLTR